MIFNKENLRREMHKGMDDIFNEMAGRSNPDSKAD